MKSVENNANYPHFKPFFSGQFWNCSLSEFLTSSTRPNWKELNPSAPTMS
jgi:hypothetical protein